MVFLVSNCQSLTGKFLYSDAYAEIPGCTADEEGQYVMPMLNSIEAIPILGHIGSAARILLSIIHMSGHALAALIYWNPEHLPHVAKGGTELLRGILTMIPIVGRLFAWHFDARNPICGHNCSSQTMYKWSFFIIKIVNPGSLDHIDHTLKNNPNFPLYGSPGL